MTATLGNCIPESCSRTRAMERGAFPWRAEFADSSYELSSKLVKSGTDNSVFELCALKMLSITSWYGLLELPPGSVVVHVCASELRLGCLSQTRAREASGLQPSQDGPAGRLFICWDLVHRRAQFLACLWLQTPGTAAPIPACLHSTPMPMLQSLQQLS